jgi:hypothetical protein
VATGVPLCLLGGSVLFPRAHDEREAPAGATRRVRAAVLLGALISFSIQSPAVRAQSAKDAEYRAKAIFLSKFPSFVEWPEEAFPPGQAPFLVCVYGDFSFGVSLVENARGETVHGRRLEVKWMHKEKDLRACQILFVSRSEAKHYRQVLDAVQGLSVLTVGETPDFLTAGGGISFLVQQDSLQFEVNLDSTSEAHLKLSSRMLALARRVVNKAAELKKAAEVKN